MQPEQRALLQHYLQLLQRWNAVYNLTAVRNAAQMQLLHIDDSLSVAEFIRGESCLDVGSGAGLPGIPLAIMQPQRHFTLLDTNGKKTMIEKTLKRKEYLLEVAELFDITPDKPFSGKFYFETLI